MLVASVLVVDVAKLHNLGLNTVDGGKPFLHNEKGWAIADDAFGPVGSSANRDKWKKMKRR